jgi:hypothetical protein
VKRARVFSSSTALLLHVVEVGAEGIEALLPRASAPVGPAAHLGEGLGPQPVDALLPRWLDVDHASFSEQAQVTGDGGLADREKLDQLGDAAFVLGQRFHDPHPGVICECGECGHR